MQSSGSINFLTKDAGGIGLKENKKQNYFCSFRISSGGSFEEIY
jgi:hypothetical protein